MFCCIAFPFFFSFILFITYIYLVLCLVRWLIMAHGKSLWCLTARNKMLVYINYNLYTRIYMCICEFYIKHAFSFDFSVSTLCCCQVFVSLPFVRMQHIYLPYRPYTIYDVKRKPIWNCTLFLRVFSRRKCDKYGSVVRRMDDT